MEKYRIAIYIRLSKEDAIKCREIPKEESNSITMQRELLLKYVKKQFINYELQEFCDDGYTGTNFQRPGIQQLFQLVRNAEIDCIIVKDFSRFARDYIELGFYLEQIFPAIGVRFISVNDNYDSKHFQGSIAGMEVNFKNLLYDLYSKDLSQKVRSALEVRKQQGQYVSANAPFGYEKDPNHRHDLVIAQDEAEVVRRIFALTLKGYTSTEITRIFNENHVKTPVEFKIEKGRIKRKPKGERFLWSNSTVCQILRNEIYIGNILQKKYEKDFVGGKNHIKPREKWVTTYQHHEPIIDREVFYQVQEGRGKSRTPQYRKTHPLTGKVVCGCCKKNLQYRHSQNPYFTCHSRYYNGMKNCVDKVNVMYLEQYVLYKMLEKLERGGELPTLHAEAILAMEKEIETLKEQKRKLNNKIQKEQNRSFQAYQAYTLGQRDNFLSGEQEGKALEEELTAINEKIREKEITYRKLKEETDSVYAGSLVTELSKDMLERYMDKIIVSDEKHLNIQWKEKTETV